MTPEQELSLANVPAKFTPLFSQAILTTIEKGQNTKEKAHDAFRYEWGVWVDDEAIVDLMKRVDELRVVSGVFEKLVKVNEGKKKIHSRYKIASGEKWDCYLHALPQNAQYENRWVTGSWTILKALTGVVEVAMLREDRDGNFKKSTKKDLRGGSDGSSFAVGGGSSSIAGEECIKYVGGPLRSYMGKSEKSILLELVLRPPVCVEDPHQVCEEWGLENLEDILDVFVPEPEKEVTEDKSIEQENKEEEESTSAQEQVQNLGSKLGMDFERVGGLDTQLDQIVRRVLASRANPELSRKLSIPHVRGLLLSGPPGCGKTLLARELARLLGAREPQIVNGPEILDKFIGEAEKRVRQLFVPAELEYAQVGDDSALHIIILDEMDAIGRKRGSASSDTTGVRDSVVNQLLAKMDGVKEANNVLVVGLTNRPELLDPALLRPGRLEVQLRVELPDLQGRRDIFRIHTRQMRENGALSEKAQNWMEDLSETGLPAKSDKFTGAEIAGLVRSAASFALARSISFQKKEKEGTDSDDTVVEFLETEEGKISVADFESALLEVRPSLGKQDELLQQRFPMGISPCSSSMQRIMRDLQRFTAPPPLGTSSSSKPHLNSLLLVGSGSGGNGGGSGTTALAAWTAAEASKNDSCDFVRFVTALDLLAGGNSGDDSARASALVDKFSEAREMSNSLLVLDDIDQLCAGSGPGGYSSVMIATLKALLRTPPSTTSTAKAGGHSIQQSKRGKSMHIIGTSFFISISSDVLLHRTNLHNAFYNYHVSITMKITKSL